MQTPKVWSLTFNNYLNYHFDHRCTTELNPHHRIDN